MVLGDFFREFPRIFRASFQFYFAPWRYFNSRSQFKPKFIATFTALTAIVGVSSASFAFVFARDLFPFEPANYAPHTIIVNGQTKLAVGPRVSRVWLFGLHPTGDLLLGLGTVDTDSISVGPNGTAPCAAFFEAPKLEGRLDRSRERFVDPTGASATNRYLQIADQLMTKTIDERDARSVDEAMRSALEGVCGKEYAYGIAQPEFELVNVSSPLRGRLRTPFLEYPGSHSFIFDPGAIILGFGLFDVEIRGVEPTQVALAIYIIFASTLLLAIGVAATLAFHRPRGLAQLTGDAFYFSVVLATVPMGFFIVGRVIEQFTGMNTCNIFVDTIHRKYMIDGVLRITPNLICFSHPILKFAGQASAILSLYSIVCLSVIAVKRGLTLRRLCISGGKFILWFSLLTFVVVPPLDIVLFLGYERFGKLAELI
jgi:hypothetical protein